MIFEDLIKTVAEEDLKSVLIEVFQIKEDDISKYIDLFLKLRTIERCEDICSTLHMENLETEDNVLVWDINYSLNKRYNHRYPIESMELNKLINSAVIREEVLSMGEANYIAHIIIIILSNEVESETDDALYAQLKERKEDIENGENKFLTVESVLESIYGEFFESDVDIKNDVY